jgi:hypothetical protein
MAVVRTEVWEERIASLIRVERISEPGTTLAVTSQKTTFFRIVLVRTGKRTEVILLVFHLFTD